MVNHSNLLPSPPSQPTLPFTFLTLLVKDYPTLTSFNARETPTPSSKILAKTSSPMTRSTFTSQPTDQSEDEDDVYRSTCGVWDPEGTAETKRRLGRIWAEGVDA